MWLISARSAYFPTPTALLVVAPSAAPPRRAARTSGCRGMPSAVKSVAKLKIDLHAGRLLELRKAANANSEPEGRGGGLLPPLLPPHRLTEKAQHSHALECSRGSAQRGTRTQLRRKKLLSGRAVIHIASFSKSSHPAQSESVPRLPSQNRAGGSTEAARNERCRSGMLSRCPSPTHQEFGSRARSAPS